MYLLLFFLFCTVIFLCVCGMYLIFSGLEKTTLHQSTIRTPKMQMNQVNPDDVAEPTCTHWYQQHVQTLCVLLPTRSPTH